MNECFMCPLSKIDGTKRKNKKKNEKMKMKKCCTFSQQKMLYGHDTASIKKSMIQKV